MQYQMAVSDLGSAGQSQVTVSDRFLPRILMEEFPVRVHMFVIRLAVLKAKPDANLANTHPRQDW
jgi:hypothetical protein